MPTLDELRTYLASIGITPPDFILEAWLEAFADLNDCLEQHYGPGVAKLIALYALGLYGIASGDRYVTSQTAPSGASQSFKYGALADRWKSQLSLLRSLDKYGCADPFLPENPTAPVISAMVGRPAPRGGCC